MPLHATPRLGLFLLFPMFAAPLLHSQTLTSTFGDTLIPDAQSAGIALSIGSAPAMSTLESVRVQLSHEWLGDLTVRLMPPGGATLTLLNRVRVGAMAPDGSSAILGEFVAVDNTFHLAPASYTFAAAGLDLASQARIVEPIIPPLIPTGPVYAAQSWISGPFAAGDWTIILADSSAMSGGLIRSVQLAYTTVPEPGVMRLLLAAALAIFGAAQCRRGLVTVTQT
jgi:subtilisin-like proprotein convertase family protein